jgi:hypothetical protein
MVTRVRDRIRPKRISTEVNKTTNHNSLSFAFGNAWSTEAGRPIYAPSATTLLTLRLNLCCPAAELFCAGGVTTIAGDLGLA